MKPTRQITVLLADDHASIRQGLRALLDRDGEIRVVGEASNGREAVEMAHALRPHVILMDISMPIINGLEATRQIMADGPSTRIVVLSAHIEDEYVERAKEVGAVGYVAKQMSAETLTWVIHEVAIGRSLCDLVKSASPAGEGKRDAERGCDAKNKSKRLTFRESEVLKLIAGGLPKTQIAARLCINSATVERHFGALMAKLSVSSIASLVAYSVAFGCVDNDVDLVIT
jgi:two-component system, NarL family, nitrate/nitrite response regulator NarL